MDSDAGSSLARRRHCLSPPPTPATTATVVLDLTFEGCVCNALSSSPKVAVQPDLHISSSLLAMTSLSTGKIYFSLPHRELSFLVGVLRRSFTRSTSTFCSEFYSSSSVANRTFPEDPKTNPLSRPLPFSATKSGVCSYSLSKTDSGNKRFNYGFINALWLRYGNIGVRNRFLAKDSAFPPNPVKHLCFYTGLKVARATSSDSSIIHRHLVSEALYPIALSHMSPWCRPKLAISSSRVCSVSSPNLRLLKLQSCSPLRLYSADKFIKSSSRQNQERSLSTSSFSEERTFPPPLLSMRDRHIPIEISEKLFNSFTVLLSRVSVYTEPEDATRLVFVMCSGGIICSFWHDNRNSLGPLIDITIPMGSRVSGLPEINEVQMFLSEEDELYQWKVGEAVASDTFDSAMTWVHLYPPLQLVFWHHVIWFKGMILKHSSISMISWGTLRVLL
ncbi:hypothetical protein Bca4012_099667 [Brassica carinata]